MAATLMPLMSLMTLMTCVAWHVAVPPRAVPARATAALARLEMARGEDLIACRRVDVGVQLAAHLIRARLGPLGLGLGLGVGAGVQLAAHRLRVQAAYLGTLRLCAASDGVSDGVFDVGSLRHGRLGAGGG